MSLFSWNDRYAVHHVQIDKQHKDLFKLAEELHSAMMRGAARNVIGATLNNLVDYTRSHFAQEEALMRATRYPRLPMHKSVHDELTKKVLGLKAGFDSGDLSITIDTMQFLRDWLENHIMVLDKDIADHVAKMSGSLAGARR